MFCENFLMLVNILKRRDTRKLNGIPRGLGFAKATANLGWCDTEPERYLLGTRDTKFNGNWTTCNDHDNDYDTLTNVEHIHDDVCSAAVQLQPVDTSIDTSMNDIEPHRSNGPAATRGEPNKFNEKMDQLAKRIKKNTVFRKQKVEDNIFSTAFLYHSETTIGIIILSILEKKSYTQAEVIYLKYN